MRTGDAAAKAAPSNPGETAEARTGGAPTEARKMADAALLLDGNGVRSLLLSSFAWGSWDACEELVTRAARLLGTRWSADSCSFMDVTLSVSLIQRSFRDALPDDVTAARQGRVLLTTAPGAQHTFGLTLLAARLRRGGWEVEMGWPFGATSRALRRGQDALGVSISGPRDFDWATEWCSRLHDRRSPGTVVFGGWGAASLAHARGITGWGPGRRELGA